MKISVLYFCKFVSAEKNMNINREKSPCTNYEGRVGFRECVAKSFMKTSNCKVNTEFVVYRSFISE